MTIKEIAKLAQVSSAAVSRYLNGGYVSREKKERISRVIDETGYRPSAQARSLRSQRSGVVGVVVPDLETKGAAEMVEGIESVLAEKNVRMLLMVARCYPEKELECMRICGNYPVDGVILAGVAVSGPVTRFLQTYRIPVVAAGQYTEKVDCVFHDETGAGKILGEWLAQRGGKYVAWIGDSGNMQAAVCGGLKSVGCEVLMAADTDTGKRSGAGYGGLMRLMDKGEKPDMIVCGSETFACGACRVASECREAAGKRPYVVCFGEKRILETIPEEIIAVQFHNRMCGSKAAELLADLIENGKNVPVQVRLGCRIEEKK